MSVWQRLRARLGKRTQVSPAPPENVEPVAKPVKAAPPVAAADELEPLRALAAGAECDAALVCSLLDRLRAGPRERAALELVSAARARHRVPESVLTRAAELYVARGQPDAALELLADARSTSALCLAADAHAERGELARALGLIERVLARDIDTPGARERHERWRTALGGTVKSVDAALSAPTLLRADAPDTTLRIVGEAGRGGAGTVYEAFDDALGRRVALKVYHRPREERDKLECEARMAITLAGRGVVRIFDADLDRGSIVMEWLAGGALKHWVNRADAAVLLPIERWLVPLSDVLARIHAAGYVHGDLKPANVVFRSVGEPVLADFGLARRAGGTLSGGSLGYMSPERLGGEAPLTCADDVYAVGRLLDDVLDRVAGQLAPAEADRFRALAEAWMRPVSERPKDAGALTRQLAARPAGPS